MPGKKLAVKVNKKSVNLYSAYSKISNALSTFCRQYLLTFESVETALGHEGCQPVRQQILSRQQSCSRQSFGCEYAKPKLQQLTNAVKNPDN